MEKNTQPVGTPTTPEAQTTDASQGQAGAAKKYADRYDSVEALEKGYKELQAQYTKLNQNKNEQPVKAEQEAAPSKNESPVTDTPVWQSIKLEFVANNGKLSDKTIELMGKKLGMTAGEARQVEKFLKQESDNGLAMIQGRLDKEVGGVTVDEVLKEAQQHLSPQQWAHVQSGLDNGLLGDFIDAAKLVAKNKKTPLKVGTVATEVGGGYSSADEIHNATNDSKFGIDKNYTRSVEARISATPKNIVDNWSSYGRKR